MVRMIALVGRKGGIGKTTVAVHLAGELAARGRSVVLVDADPQASAAAWAAPGKLPMPVRKMPVNADALPAWVKAIRTLDAEVVVLDCPPHLDAALGAAVSLADLAILPCGPSGVDTIAMAEVLGVLRAVRSKRNGKPAAMIVPNRVDRRTYEGREIADELAKIGEPVGPALPYRASYVRAFNSGEFVRDAEVTALANAVWEIVK